jgi:hypothetical protein
MADGRLWQSDNLVSVKVRLRRESQEINIAVSERERDRSWRGGDSKVVQQGRMSSGDSAF